MDPSVHLEHARLSVAVLAARERGDLRTATELLAAFPDVGAMASGFLTVAELALQVGARQANMPPSDLLQEVGHGLAAAQASHRDDGGSE